METAFEYAGIEIEWQGKGTDEKGVIGSLNPDIASDNTLKPGDTIVEIDPRYFRPTEVELLLADISKAKKELKWEPKFAFKELVKIMMDSDLTSAGVKTNGEGEKILKENGILWTENKHITAKAAVA